MDEIAQKATARALAAISPYAAVLNAQLNGSIAQIDYTGIAAPATSIPGVPAAAPVASTAAMPYVPPGVQPQQPPVDPNAPLPGQAY